MMPGQGPGPPLGPGNAMNPRAKNPRSSPLLPAVVHAGVLHAQHRGVLGLLEPAVEDLAGEEGVVAAVEVVAHGAVDPGHGLVEHGRPGRPVMAWEAVEGVAGLVDLD